MKRSFCLIGMAAILVGGWLVAKVRGQQSESNPQGVLYLSADRANFVDLHPNAVSRSVIWGNPDTGAHAAFFKFAPGWDAGMHSHTNELSIVVVKGAYLYRDETGEKRVGPGDFLRIPGGKGHRSGGDPKEGALFYEESTGKFDAVFPK